MKYTRRQTYVRPNKPRYVLSMRDFYAYPKRPNIIHRDTQVIRL